MTDQAKPQAERLQLAPTRGQRVAAALVVAAAIVPDVVGLVAFALVCRGVYVLWGTGFMYLVAGSLLLIAYVWGELRPPVRQRRSEG